MLLEFGLDCLNGQQAPHVSDKSIHYVVFGTFAKTEEDYDNGHGKKELRVLTLVDLLKSRISNEDFKKLSSFEKAVPEANKAARKRLLEAMSDVEEAEEID